MVARRRALQLIHAVGITPNRQVLDNKTNMAYRREIMATGMTYQIVPPDDHRQNIAGKKSKCGNTTSLQYAAVSPLTFQCTYGSGSSHKYRNSCYYSDNKMSTQKFQLLLIYTDRITIMRNHLSPLAWKPWYTINRHDKKHFQSTAAKALCSARSQIITDAGTYGLQVQNQQECQAQFFKSITTSQIQKQHQQTQ